MLVVVALLTAAAPATAHADDAAVRAAWDSEDARLAKLTTQTSKALSSWSRTGLKKTGTVLRLLAETDRTARRVEQRLTTAKPSTDHGQRAQTAALQSLSQYRSSLRLTIRTVLAAAAGRMKTARALSRRARALERAARAGGQSAERWFTAAAEARDQTPQQEQPASAKPQPAPQAPPQQQPPSPPPAQQPPPQQQPPPPQEEPGIWEMLEIPPAP